MSSGIIDTLPASWFQCELKEQVIDYIRNLPIDPIDRKNALLDWCRISDCTCTAEDFARVTGEPAGEI